MDFSERLLSVSKRVSQQSDIIETEEATKTALIMPFIHQVLGYDVFNPAEVIPEFTADVGVKKGEKIDYAIVDNSEIAILIEAKKIGEELNEQHASQLFRYFGTTTAKIAILTNGRYYRFYTDLDAPNKMDSQPFLELDMLDIDAHIVPEIKKLTKANFDVDSVVNAAGELKYLSQLKHLLEKQIKDPAEDFIRFCITNVYGGIITQKVREQFTPLIQKALTQFIDDRVNNRLKSALAQQTDSPNKSAIESIEITDENEIPDDGIVTTEEELEGFNIVKAIVRKHIDAERICQRDTKSYFGILLDDNNRKPICRLHFNRSQKYIGIFDEEKVEERHPIESLDDIFNFEEALVKTALSYES